MENSKRKRKSIVTRIIKYLSSSVRCDERILTNLIKLKSDSFTNSSQDSDINEIIELIQNCEGIDISNIDELIQYYKKQIALTRCKIEYWEIVKNSISL